MKKLNVITCTTGVFRYAWETYVFLNNMRECNLSQNTHVLVWIPYSLTNQKLDPLWQKITSDFPETEFFFHNDVENFEKFTYIIGYNPLFRPYILSKYFQKNTYLENEAIFYVDTDILLRRNWKLDDYLHDDIMNLS